MKQEKSCGVICYTCRDGRLCVLLIRQKHGGHWAFPKGHVEEGETEQQTALRELREETGAEAVLDEGYREVVTYSPARGVMKDVVFFTGRLTGGQLQCQPEEIRRLAFVPVTKALRMLTFRADKDLLRKALRSTLPPQNSLEKKA